MTTEVDEQRVEEIAREHSLVNLIRRENHKPPFPREVWDVFILIDGGRGQSIGDYVPAYEKAFAEAVGYLRDIGVLTTTDNGAYAVLESSHILNPRTLSDEILYFVNKKDAEQYSLFWGRDVRIRKLSSD